MKGAAGKSWQKGWGKDTVPGDDAGYVCQSIEDAGACWGELYFQKVGLNAMARAETAREGESCRSDWIGTPTIK